MTCTMPSGFDDSPRRKVAVLFNRGRHTIIPYRASTGAVEPDRLKKATARVCTRPPSLCLRCVSGRPRAWLPYKHTACLCKLVILELSLNYTGKVSGPTDDMTS